MKRRWHWMLVCSILVVAFFGYAWATDYRLFGDIIPSNIPDGVTFQSLDKVTDWEIRPALKIMPDPSQPNGGTAAVKFQFTSRAPTTLEDVQVAIFLPDALYAYTPMAIFGTNQQESHLSVSPSQPQFIITNAIHFPDYEQRERVKRTFNGMTRLKITWKGGERYVEFPFSYWEVEIPEG